LTSDLEVMSVSSALKPLYVMRMRSRCQILADHGSATLNLAWRTCNFQRDQSGVIPAIATVIS